MKYSVISKISMVFEKFNGKSIAKWPTFLTSHSIARNRCLHGGNFDGLAFIPAMIGTVLVFLCFILLFSSIKKERNGS